MALSQGEGSCDQNTLYEKHSIFFYLQQKKRKKTSEGVCSCSLMHIIQLLKMRSSRVRGGKRDIGSKKGNMDKNREVWRPGNGGMRVLISLVPLRSSPGISHHREQKGFSHRL